MSHEGRTSPVAWLLALASAAVIGSLATACMMPFVAVGTIAAATMPRAQALTAMLVVWAANQMLGFGLLGYPVDNQTLGWAVALCASSVAALLVARRNLDGRQPTLIRLALAFATAFAAYEGLLFAFALLAGGTLGAFTPAVVLLILGNDAGWLAALAIMHLLLTRSAPRVFGTSPALRIA